MGALQTIDIKYFQALVGREQAAGLLARSGLTSKTRALPSALDLPLFWRLCAENIQSRNDESHGIAREPVPRGSLSVLFISAKEGDTLIEAVERLSATAQLVRKECQITLGKSRGALHLTMKPRGRSDLRAEIYIECFAVVVHCALRWMTGRRLDPVKVRGSSKSRNIDNTLLAAFHAPWVRRGTGVTITYAKHDLHAPILAQKYRPWGDQEFENFLALVHEHDDPAVRKAQAYKSVRELLYAGMHSQQAVSEAMHWSVATLRRRLTDEGTSFRRLSAEVRRAKLQDLLATDVSVEDIAEKLGLSDDRSLRRVCQRCLGMSPHRYRQSLQRSPSVLDHSG